MTYSRVDERRGQKIFMIIVGVREAEKNILCEVSKCERKHV